MTATPTPADIVPSHPRKRHATVFIIMDAGRADYVDQDSMPFLHALSQGSLRGSFESPPGFAQRTVLFSGRYPDTSGNFSAFVFDPEESPFTWVRKLGPLRSLVKPRKILFPARWGINKATKLLNGTYHADPAWIPPKFLPFFRPCEDMRPLFEPGALGAASIFDLCRAHDLRFRYLAHPVSGDDEDVHATLVREIRAGAPYDLYVAQLSTPDQQGHVHGPASEAMRKGYMREMDRKVASVHAALAASHASWDLFICGDHGMATVERRIDILGALKNARAKPAKDYVVFVNSTLAVFWYLTDKGRREIEAILPRIPGTEVIDDARRKKLRIPTDRRWGDRMLAAQAGVLFWPDYFHVKDSTIKGMHGYLDKKDETHGMMVIAGSEGRARAGDVGLRPLVDVFPTLCDLLGVPVPKTQEGTSILSNGHSLPPQAPLIPVTSPVTARPPNAMK
ncbi:MAG: alkaline phosphatase family protein [Thermoplasmatota archaeon]|nr:alkaline phosphatase family protein [Halobacteriales archaeon]